MSDFYVYAHFRPDGTPFYVGKGRGYRSRKFSNRSVHHQNIVAKYGRENIKTKMFYCESEDRAFSLEIALIAKYRSEGHVLCNQTDGGEGAVGAVRDDKFIKHLVEINKGKVLSIEHRLKIAAAHTGKKASAESKAKQSATRKGRPMLPTTRAALLAANTGRRMTAENLKLLSARRTGAIASAETREKIAAANRGKHLSEELRTRLSAIHKARIARKRNEHA